MIPEHDDHGLLPPGIHPCTLDEARERFCWTARRAMLFEGLLRYIEAWWPRCPSGSTLLIDGSFVRRKDEPGDVDVVIELPAEVAAVDALSFALLCHGERPRIKVDYNVEVMVWYEGCPMNITAFFQYIGEKAAAELQLHHKHPKGILRITP